MSAEPLRSPGAGLALDDRARSARALDVALEIAAACHTEVALVHVVDPRLLVTPDGGIGPDALRTEFERSGHALLLAAAERIAARGIARDEAGIAGRGGEPRPVAQFLEHGRPAHEIVRVAGEWLADLVVVGTQGRSALARALLGSTAAGVLHHAHRPVLVVPAHT